MKWDQNPYRLALEVSKLVQLFSRNAQVPFWQPVCSPGLPGTYSEVANIVLDTISGLC